MSERFDQMEPMAAALRAQVLDLLVQRVSPLLGPSWNPLCDEIRRLDSALQEANAWRAEDLPGALYVKVSSCLLAIYRTLLPHFRERQTLLDHLKAVIHLVNFQGGMDAFLLDHYGISKDAPDEAWSRICTNFILRGRERFGSGWVVEQGIRDEKRCFFNFRRCGFADFFLENNARELLYLLCATDYAWGDALEEKYGIRFERPTTLAEGADACRFQLFRMK